MKKVFYGYHGDTDWFTLDKLPKKAELVGKFKEFVAQHGTATGHSHRVKSDTEFDVYKLSQKDADADTSEHYIYVFNAPAEISHEEHRTFDFVAGIYFQDQEHEESPQDGMVRKVID